MFSSLQLLPQGSSRYMMRNIFLISPWKYMFSYFLEAPQWGTSKEYENICFSWRNKKNISTFQLKKKIAISALMNFSLKKFIISHQIWLNVIFSPMVFWVRIILVFIILFFFSHFSMKICCKTSLHTLQETISIMCHNHRPGADPWYLRESIWSNDYTNSFRQTGPNKQCRPRSDAAEYNSDQGLHCLPLSQQFFTLK